MEATACRAATGPRNYADFASPARDFIAQLLGVLLLFAALFLLARRCAGALNEPLAFTALVGVGLAATMTAEAIRLLHPQSNRSSAKWLPRLALPVVALAVSLPGSSVVGLLLMWLIVIGEESRSWRTRAMRRATHSEFPESSGAPATLRGHDRLSEVQSMPAEQWHDQKVAQQISYRSTAEGRAIVQGWLRANFAAGQQTSVVHVAFCPPFIGVPQVEAEPLEGPACDVRSTLVVPWGIRWEVKLAEPAAAATSVVLEFFAAELSHGRTAADASGGPENSM